MQIPLLLIVASLAAAAQGDSPPKTAPNVIAINRTWEKLEVPSGPVDYRALFEQAGRKLGTWSVTIDANRISGKRLRTIAASAAGEPFLRVVREALRRPLDIEDFLYFIDDVLVAGDAGGAGGVGGVGIRGQLVWVPASRARAAGIFIHPDDVFVADKPRRYGEQQTSIKIDRPRRMTRLPAARDGEPLGPRWCSRFPNPSGRAAKFRALDALNPSGTFAARMQLLMKQLTQTGAAVLLYSTVRDRRRGYLMWGGYLLSRQVDEAAVTREVQRLDSFNKEWGLDIPIRWQHPRGWQATIEAARQMADTYMIAYASQEGARASSHYGGTAVDLNVFGLPRSVKLVAPDGTARVFDLSDPRETRDLSLSPQIIDWVEEHFQLRKLKNDYPHWDDVAPPRVSDGGKQ